MFRRQQQVNVPFQVTILDRVIGQVLLVRTVPAFMGLTEALGMQLLFLCHVPSCGGLESRIGHPVSGQCSSGDLALLLHMELCIVYSENNVICKPSFASAVCARRYGVAREHNLHA